MTNELIEYRVRPASRYIVTRYSSGDNSVGATCLGEFDNVDQAYGAAYALCKVEHEKLGWPPGDERIQYPRYPGHMSDCAVHNGPALDPGPCDCGATQI